MFGQLNSHSLVSVFIARIHNQWSVYSVSTNNENPDQFALMRRLTWIYYVRTWHNHEYLMIILDILFSYFSIKMYFVGIH